VKTLLNRWTKSWADGVFARSFRGLPAPGHRPSQDVCSRFAAGDLDTTIAGDKSIPQT
jgi:hypothetical protein